MTVKTRKFNNKGKGRVPRFFWPVIFCPIIVISNFRELTNEIVKRSELTIMTPE